MPLYDSMSPRSIKIPNEQLFPVTKRLISEGHSVVITVVGRSMEPFFESRREDVRLSQCDSIKPDDMVLALTRDGRYVAHRVVSVKDGEITMRGDGNPYGVEYARTCDVVGKVTAYRRRGSEKFHPLYSWRWRVYSMLWPRWGVARRVLLAFHHRIYLPLYRIIFHPDWL